MDPAVQVWINTDDDKNVGAIATALEKRVSANQDKQMKGFIVFINPDRQSKERITPKLEKLAADNKLKNVALVYLSGPNDEAVSDYKINTDPSVKNTVFVYKDRTVDSKFVNFAPDKKSLDSLDDAIQKVLK